MKIGIVGTGSVGCASAMAAVVRGSAREIVLVNRTRKTAEAVATDIRYGVPVGRKVDLIDGDYADLKDARVVLVTSGVNEKTGGATDRNDPQGRLRLLGKNAEIYRDIVPKIVDAAPQAVLLVVTDPPDPLADIARETRLGATVLSAGTHLDSQRFRVHLGKHFSVDPAEMVLKDERAVISDRKLSQEAWGDVVLAERCGPRRHHRCSGAGTLGRRASRSGEQRQNPQSRARESSRSWMTWVHAVLPDHGRGAAAACSLRLESC